MTLKAFSCTLKTPKCSREIETDSWEGFVSTILSEVSRIIEVHTTPVGKGDLDSTAKAILDAYYERFMTYNNRAHPLIAEAGLGLDLVKCYLFGMTVIETSSWFNKHTSFKIGKSSAGRYWKRFSTLCIARKGDFAALRPVE